ncbi:MAG: TIGR02281 family clan AA aspartic protease [Alphaproteobacteria bacterium]|nr:TIGR02281 family clan AA aspartic protease [Alphaproteobacteria bacterium]MCB9929168.1 TIGR02281 family clan AA aspartic protease [Alphaproteobacteria bacterium]
MGDLSSSETARLFYLSVLGIVLLVSVFSLYRHRLGQSLQHVAIWGLIFVAVVLAFGFKDELLAIIQADKGRVVDARTMSFTRDRDGHFYARLAVDGQDVSFLIDTGASDLVLTREAAARVGLDVDRLDFSRPAQTANGTVLGAPVVLRTVTLGPFEDRDVPAVVNGGDLDTSLLGMSYLKRFRSFQIQGDRMTLVR